MLYRRIKKDIEEYLRSEDDRIMILEGARQIGKSFIIREVGKRLYDNFIEINFAEDDEGPQMFKEIGTTEGFYFTLSSAYGEKLDRYENTLVFLDEIQHYPQYLTLLKFFREDRRFRFIASGSLLEITLRETTSIPVGSIIRKNMYQLDFEEFLIANGFGQEALYPLAESAQKNLMKLYLNDVGLLTLLLYKNNIRPVIADEDSVNLGSVYESVVAQELKAHGHKLFYYDNKQRGEVDFLIDDYSSTTILPIEVKSGKDYTRHSALNNLLKVRDYNIASGLVLSNSREIKTVGNVTYMPVYYVMFINADAVEELYF